MSAVGRVLAWVALTPIVVLVAGIGGCEVRKAYYDSQVRKMCEKDGGVTVIESVTLKRAEYEGFLNQFGKLDIPSRERAPVGTALLHVYKYEYYRENPRVTRGELSVMRAADNKVLGTQVSYSRVGGDFLAFHPSIFSCPSVRPDLFALVVQQSKE